MSKATDDLLFDPEVAKVTRLVLLRGGIREDRLEDHASQVLAKLRAWLDTRAEDERPKAIEDWKRVVRVAAKRHAIDVARSDRTHAETHAGLTDQEDEHAAPGPDPGALEPLDVKAILEHAETVRSTSRQPERITAALLGLQEGKTHGEVAKSLGVSEQSMKHTLFKFRKELGVHLKRAGYANVALYGLSALAGGVLVVVYAAGLMGGGPVAHDPRSPRDLPSSLPEPPPSAKPPEVLVNAPSPALQRREQLLREAKADLDAKKWKECLGAFVAMDALDAGVAVESPAGMEAYRVRNTCEVGFAKEYRAK